ncbi:hypothetical protein AN936_19210 [Sphingopyxis macrogoltabida]|uniref:Uncharacterized protein n=2 Tax=Sphingopyxis macrogoltabida TaxID=33050 RepID=A0A0N9UAI5_SPHMC|nr:hypothetical protein AN936_19210 [Sphingopyxis macrogoltabida]
MAWAEGNDMKQRNAMVAVWTALFIAIGATLSLAMPDSKSPLKGDPFVLSKNELKPGERRPVVVSPEAVEVRLFVDGLPFRESSHVQALMNDTEGLRLSRAQREILDRSLTRHRLSPSESDATPACYDPHHFFRYFDAKGERIGELEVCYCCRQVRLYAPDQKLNEGEIWEFDFEGAAKLLKAMNVPTDINCPGRG